MIFLFIIQLVLFYNILANKGYFQLKWFLIFLLFVPPGVVLFQNDLLNRDPYKLLVAFLAIGTIFRYRSQLPKAWKSFPIKRSYLFLFTALLLIGLFDSRLSVGDKLYRPISLFLENFSILFVGYIVIKHTGEAFKFFNFLIFVILGFCIYGFVVYILKENPYITGISGVYGVRDISNDYMTVDERFRVSSFFFHPIFYGFLLCATVTIILYFIQFRVLKVKMYMFYIILICCIVNLFLTNSRTPLFALLLGVIIYFASQLKSRFAMRAVFAGLVVIVFASPLPQVQKVYDQIIDVFTTGGENSSGSSVKMRDEQLAASFLLYAKNPVFGNGIRYINDDLGWGADLNKRKDTGDLRGFESYFFVLLIEQGIMGITANILLFAGLITFFIRSMIKTRGALKKFCLLNLVLVMQYLFFILSTGTIGTMAFFFLLMGVSIKTIVLRRESTLAKIIISQDTQAPIEYAG